MTVRSAERKNASTEASPSAHADKALVSRITLDLQE